MFLLLIYFGIINSEPIESFSASDLRSDMLDNGNDTFIELAVVVYVYVWLNFSSFKMLANELSEI